MDSTLVLVRTTDDELLFLELRGAWDKGSHVTALSALSAYTRVKYIIFTHEIGTLGFATVWDRSGYVRQFHTREKSS